MFADKTDELQKLLESAELVRSDNTGFCGEIRILKVKEGFVVQERSDKGEILVRRFDTLDQARAFVDQRLAEYDRMWDGCGCKIDYHG